MFLQRIQGIVNNLGWNLKNNAESHSLGYLDWKIRDFYELYKRFIFLNNKYNVFFIEKNRNNFMPPKNKQLC